MTKFLMNPSRTKLKTELAVSFAAFFFPVLRLNNSNRLYVGAVSVSPAAIAAIALWLATGDPAGGKVQSLSTPVAPAGESLSMTAMTACGESTGESS